MNSAATTTIADANDGLQMTISIPVIPSPKQQTAVPKGTTIPPEQIKWQVAGVLKVTLTDTKNGCSIDVPPESEAFKALQSFQQTGVFPATKSGDQEVLAIQQVIRSTGAGGLFFGLGIMGGASSQTITGPENKLPGDLSGLAHLVKDCKGAAR